MQHFISSVREKVGLNTPVHFTSDSLPLVVASLGGGGGIQ